MEVAGHWIWFLHNVLVTDGAFFVSLPSDRTVIWYMSFLRCLNQGSLYI